MCCFGGWQIYTLHLFHFTDQIHYYTLQIVSGGVADLYHVVMLFVPCIEVDEREVRIVVKVIDVGIIL